MQEFSLFYDMFLLNAIIQFLYIYVVYIFISLMWTGLAGSSFVCQVMCMDRCVCVCVCACLLSFVNIFLYIYVLGQWMWLNWLLYNSYRVAPSLVQTVWHVYVVWWGAAFACLASYNGFLQNMCEFVRIHCKSNDPWEDMYEYVSVYGCPILAADVPHTPESFSLS